MLNRLRRIVDRGLMGIMPNSYVSPLTPPQYKIYKKLANFDKQSSGHYTFSDGSVTPLYTKYRDFVKRTWRLQFPALNYLYHMREDYELPAQTFSILDDILRTSTLTVSEDVLNQHVQAVAEKYPLSRQASVKVGHTEVPVYMNPRHVPPVLRNYRNLARTLETRLRRYAGLTLKGLHTLEIGTGTGLQCYALAERGTAFSTGIDIDYSADRNSFWQEAFEQKRADVRSRVELLRMNANQTSFEDETFDLIHSTSVLEHVQELPQTFKEMYRLLKPGGWAIHSIGPYFGPAGGHALITLDFPWGHVRLTDEQIRSYLKQYRPYEQEKADKFLRTGLTQPHYVLSDYAVFAMQAGFEIVHWQENVLDNHRLLLAHEVFQQAQVNCPRVTINDMLTNELILILNKPYVA